jgi:hypothetical protein
MGYNLPYKLLSTLLPDRLVGEEYIVVAVLMKGVVSHSSSPGQGGQDLLRLQEHQHRRGARVEGYPYYYYYSADC